MTKKKQLTSINKQHIEIDRDIQYVYTISCFILHIVIEKEFIYIPCVITSKKQQT